MPAAPASNRPRNGSRSNFRGGKPAADRPLRPADAGPFGADHEILFQQYFKSVGPRTYAAQVKRATNGNHYIVLTEGKRDEKTDEVRKTRLFVFAEDFVEFFRLMKGLSEFVKANPVPEEVKKKRDRFWAKQAAEAKPQVKAPQSAGAVPTPAAPTEPKAAAPAAL